MGSRCGTVRVSSDAESARNRFGVFGSALWRGDAQHGLPAVEKNAAGHERATFCLSGGKRLEFILNPRRGLKPNLKLAMHSPCSRPSTLDELFPATHAFGSVLQPEGAGDRKVNTVRRAAGVHVFNSTRIRTDRSSLGRPPRQ